ncbi:hypothetical protein HNR23_001079 [Nocardiopsis mwathae]|uniref:DUF3558 domain-containing protein n=1 Tax=Nocardiopsis mwathae TaxID=1472723 RepID=A0A7X0D5D6_9ACTN|nr:DUF3558 domain-containing protein [Nocardiopsis mwathae]MBB6171019.1 hypothetical protein [Nocardiopsis mwathae]
MSDNGPYPQPPQFPQDGEGGSGGQPPYGGPYGQPGPEQGGPHPGQQYASGPYQAPYGGQNPGGQPGYPYGAAQQGGPQPGGPGYQPPHDQNMYAPPPGQPPYGGPGMPGGPGDYPPPQKKSSAGMWVVIGGGAVILILVIAVFIVVLRPSGDTSAAAPQQAEQSEADKPDADADSDGGDEPKADKGEPPYDLPEDACQTYTEDKLSEYAISDGSKNLSDNRSSCRWRVDGEGDTWGSFSLEYKTPYAGSDSVEGAKDDFKSAVKFVTDENNRYTEREVHEEQDVKLGDEAKLVFSTEKLTNSNYSVATLLVREGNINTEVKFQMSPGLGADESVPAPLKFSDVEDMMLDLGKQSLTPIGA